MAKRKPECKKCKGVHWTKKVILRCKDGEIRQWTPCPKCNPKGTK